MDGTQERKHAVVIGGSMAGLLAARVLRDHFQTVTLIERDVCPEAAEVRRGVPQGRHAHGLLASGRQVLEQLFPGIGAELVQAGAVPGDLVRDGRWFHEGACLSRPKSGLDGLLVSRPLLETTVRRRLRELTNVVRGEGQVAEGLTSSGGVARVTGVQLSGGGSLAADLVVDATGRGSRSPQWLEALGFPAPREERVEIALSYTTRQFRRRRGDLDGDTAAVIPPTPEGKRGGVILRQEEERWIVTLVAHFVKSAPSDLPGFIEFAHQLHAPFIYEVIRDAEPIGEAASARFPASLRRRYEELPRFPEGYLVVGDAICSFNPVYGQGMSVAAMEAMELSKTVAEGDGHLAPRFFSRAARLADIPWSIAAGNDLRMPEAVGPRTPAVNFVNWYVSKLHRAAHHDPELAVAFHRVSNLLAPPASLMRPRMAARVLRGNLWHKREAAGEMVRSAAGGA